VERWNAFARKRVDLFGVIDVVAITPEGILGVQVTSGTNHSARVKKAKEEPAIVEWLKAGGKFEVWSFRKKMKGKQARWVLRSERFEWSGTQIVVVPLGVPTVEAETEDTPPELLRREELRDADGG
jgi:hypothetical protein